MMLTQWCHLVVIHYKLKWKGGRSPEPDLLRKYFAFSDGTSGIFSAFTNLFSQWHNETSVSLFPSLEALRNTLKEDRNICTNSWHWNCSVKTKNIWPCSSFFLHCTSQLPLNTATFWRNKQVNCHFWKSYRYSKWVYSFIKHVFGINLMLPAQTVRSFWGYKLIM